VDGSSVERFLADSRRGLERVEAERLADEMAAGALVVDIRPVENRDAEGLLPGAVVVDRNVLEWRLDPTSPHRLPESDDPDRRVILVCNEGFASSLAAETLQRIGLHRATDLVGGYRAWRRVAGGDESSTD
jgi:rhodanese-related sulfurtransferase